MLLFPQNIEFGVLSEDVSPSDVPGKALPLGMVILRVPFRII